jgi:pimeloyl-ACP methyl ester carboxylesterase
MIRNFSYQGGNISYSDNGSGSTIVLLHGYLESSEIWNSFAEKLAERFRVISIDLPGHGASDIYGEIHTMEFMAGAVNGLLEELNMGSVFMAGHSMGGYVTLAFLESFPEKLSAYCLFHSQPFADQPAAIEKRRREIEIVKAGKKHLMYPDNVERMYASVNLGRLTDALRRSKEIASRIPDKGIIAVLSGMIARPSRAHLMEEGKVPCLWILGEMDNYIPRETIQSKVKLPPNSEVVILKNSGHMGFVEEEEESLKAITGFAGKLTLSAT